MQFEQTTLKDAWLIALDPARDYRGYFARTFSVDEFAAQGLEANFPQHSISFNARSGTVRGMHFQNKPHQEAKLVRCTQGAIYDVAIDLRSDSPTRYQWVGAELTSDNHRMLYIPEGFAHGYQTLADSTEIFYQMSEFYHPESTGGVRWNDPAFDLTWPLAVTVIAERDATYPLIDRTNVAAP